MRRTLQSISSQRPQEADEVSVTYQAWVISEQVPAIRDAVQHSGLSWSQWSAKAIARLEREDDKEIEYLVTTWPRSRKGKTSLSFRLFPSTLERSQAIAKKHGGTVQAVFGHAFCMEAMAFSSPTAEAQSASVSR